MWGRKLGGALAVVGLVVATCYVAHRALLSDEARIRERLAAMAAGFNAGAVGPVAAGLAATYRDQTLRLDRERLLARLRYLVGRERRAGKGAFRYRVEVPAEAMTVTVEGQAARATFRVRCFRRRRAGWSDPLEAEVEAELRKGDAGWQVTRTRHRWRGARRRF